MLVERLVPSLSKGSGIRRSRMGLTGRMEGRRRSYQSRLIRSRTSSSSEDCCPGSSHGGCASRQPLSPVARRLQRVILRRRELRDQSRRLLRNGHDAFEGTRDLYGSDPGAKLGQ